MTTNFVWQANFIRLKMTGIVSKLPPRQLDEGMGLETDKTQPNTQLYECRTI
jgi:hypothetical protein